MPSLCFASLYVGVSSAVNRNQTRATMLLHVLEAGIWHVRRPIDPYVASLIVWKLDNSGGKIFVPRGASSSFAEREYIWEVEDNSSICFQHWSVSRKTESLRSWIVEEEFREERDDLMAIP
jgi:hypothetical protein